MQKVHFAPLLHDAKVHYAANAFCILQGVWLFVCVFSAEHQKNHRINERCGSKRTTQGVNYVISTVICIRPQQPVEGDIFWHFQPERHNIQSVYKCNSDNKTRQPPAQGRTTGMSVAAGRRPVRCPGLNVTPMNQTSCNLFLAVNLSINQSASCL